MAISKQKKQQMMAAYREMLGRAKGLVITEYRGFSMKNFNAVRSSIRKVDGSFTVTHTTIFMKALKEFGFAVPEDLLTGPVAIAIAYGELGTLTKTVIDAKKDNDKLVLKGGIMGDMVFRGEAGLETLSTLPTLDQARASFVGALQAPAGQLVSLFSQPAQQMAQILKAYTDKSQEGESAAD